MMRYLKMYFLSAVYIFIGKVLVFMLADQHALGYTNYYYIINIGYYLTAVLIIFWTLKFIYINKLNQGKSEFVLDGGIFVLFVILVYIVATMFIKKYVAHFV